MASKQHAQQHVTGFADPIDTLRVLNRATVKSLMPPILQQIEIVCEVYESMTRGGVELPPKVGVHTREDAFLHAMPAYLRDSDVAGLKWVSGYPENRSSGLPYILGLIVLNDAATGAPIAVLDGAEITAARTAAASGACVSRFAPRDWQRAAILGCGEQGRFHAAVLESLNPEVTIAAFDPDATRASSLHPRATACSTPEEAVAGAQVVISACPLKKEANPILAREWLPDECLLLPVDFDFFVGPEIVKTSSHFAVDDIGQYDYFRSLGYMRGWPDAQMSTGGLMCGERPEGGVTTILNVGVGALDIAFASAVLRAAPTH
jgi:ornithine cyclodeaminase/alanine dehydrogenase-like protein (mu-crystallin family)